MGFRYDRLAKRFKTWLNSIHTFCRRKCVALQRENEQVQRENNLLHSQLKTQPEPLDDLHLLQRKVKEQADEHKQHESYTASQIGELQEKWSAKYLAVYMGLNLRLESVVVKPTPDVSLNY